MEIAFVHIFAGLVSIVAGAFALAARKGGLLHRKSGTVFVYAMMGMAVGAAGLAVTRLHIPLMRGNFIGAILVFYFVLTAYWTVRRPSPDHKAFDVAAMFVALALGLLAVGAGLFSVYKTGKILSFSATPSLILGTIALLGALGDGRILLGRVLDRPHRIARHLWRMCFGMFGATGSLFLGQAKVFPQWLQIPLLLAVPVFIVLGLMFFWWARVLMTKRVPHAAPRLVGSVT